MPAAEEAVEDSGSAVMASGSQLQQAGRSEAPEDDPCPICLGEIDKAARVALCFHRFCFGCIQRWAAMRPVCPLCRRPFDRILRVPIPACRSLRPANPRSTVWLMALSLQVLPHPRSLHHPPVTPICVFL
uniref:RING-type E3 ubiquitin transferase n=1 Tax=Falco tinnunculus TaxID=100819 RepID=A0A8C4V3Y1_FALTI